MWKYAVLLSYMGTNYWGWQKQKSSATKGLKHSSQESPQKSSQDSPQDRSKAYKSTLQQTLEEALGRMTGEVLSCVGSGRTDSGVHSIGQVAHFVLKTKEWDPVILQRGLNGILPRSFRVMGIRKVSLDFHAQRSALKKQYSYYFQQGPCALPHLEPTSWWIQKRLNLDQMSKALEHLIGEHDFKPFQASGSKPGPTVRKILQAEVSLDKIACPTRDFGRVRVRIVGTGFLKQMVRGIAGTLLQVGEGRREPSCMQEILSSGSRTLVGPTAPARALWLEQVWYPESYELNW